MNNRRGRASVHLALAMAVLGLGLQGLALAGLQSMKLRRAAAADGPVDRQVAVAGDRAGADITCAGSDSHE
jgi:hypothetical protein